MQGHVLARDHVKGGSGQLEADRCRCGDSPCTWQFCQDRVCSDIAVPCDIVLERYLVRSQC